MKKQIKDKDAPRYSSLGVSASKSGLHAALQQANLAESSGYFAKVVPDIAGDPAYYSFMHADGAGTKSIVAYLFFRETGKRDLFAHLAQDALVMNLDDIFCVGHPEKMLLSNAIARNSRLVDDGCIGEIIRSYTVLAEKLAGLDIGVEICGGETADCGDVVRTLLVDAVVSGRIRKDRTIRADAIAAGDAIVSLSSTGKACYEETENSGIGSNGLTLARHALLHEEYLSRYPEVADEGLSKKIAYQGPFKVSDPAPGMGVTIGEALASPTRTYAPVLARIYRELEGQVHAAIHLTGGAHTKVLRFGKEKLFVKDNLFPTPPLFSLIQRHGKVGWKEMYQVFNMGQRMELYLPEKHAARAIAISEALGIQARLSGRVEEHRGKENKVVLRTEHGELEYTFAQ